MLMPSQYVPLSAEQKCPHDEEGLLFRPGDGHDLARNISEAKAIKAYLLKKNVGRDAPRSRRASFFSTPLKYRETRLGFGHLIDFLPSGRGGCQQYVLPRNKDNILISIKHLITEVNNYTESSPFFEIPKKLS